MLIASCVVALGCASTGATPPAQTPAAGVATVPAVEACRTLGKQLCDELGPSSESCRAAIGIVGLLPVRACEEGIAGFEEARGHVRDMRASCDELAKTVCRELGEDSESCAALRSDLPEIPPGHCPMLLRDQEQIVAALKARETLDVPLSEEQWSALLTSSAPSVGATDAKVTIVAFSDFQCPYCAESARTMRRLKDSHGAKIRIVFRQYPLSFHEHAKPAASAALAAHAQNKFWEYHDMLFAHQDELGEASLMAYAEKLGLDMAKFRAALGAPATVAAVHADIELGDAVHVRGTPTVFVNRKRLENGVEYDAVAAAVDEALSAVQP
jgi:protein-disulfide isomerase